MIKTNVRQSSKEKDKKPNKEKENVSNHSVKTTIYSSKPNNRLSVSVVQEREEDAPSIRWRRFNRNKKIQEEKPQEEKPHGIAVSLSFKYPSPSIGFIFPNPNSLFV